MDPNNNNNNKNNNNNNDRKASMAEQQQQFSRLFPQLAQPSQPPFPPNNSLSPPLIYSGGGGSGSGSGSGSGNDSTLAASSSTNFHPGSILPNSTPSNSLLATTRESRPPLVCNGSHGADNACPFVFPLQVEIAKLQMELRKKDMDIKNLKQHVIGLLQLTSSTPVSTTASVHDQLGQLTIGSRNNTPDTNNNIRRGRSLERRASPSNTLNLIAHLKFSLEELRGSQILQMAIDKDNYQVLKRTIEHGNNVEINYVFEKLKGYIPKLCHNSYGSQVIIQLLNLRHCEKIRQVFSLVLPELVNLCYEPNGAAVIEKLVECVAEPEQITQLFCALMTQLLGLSQNGYSHKVIERCIKTFPNEWDKYFMNTVLENCMALGTDKHGCCVLQKCLQHGSAIARHRLVEEVLKDALHYSKHFYGNYVMQCVVNQNIFGFADRVMERLKGNFVALSMHKFSSNVVEKILNNASIEKVRDIINEIVEDPNVLTLFQDQYGNFVIQKALTATVKWPNKIYDAIAKVIENNHSTLDCNMYGKRVINCLTKLRTERRSSYRLANLKEPSNI